MRNRNYNKVLKYMNKYKMYIKNTYPHFDENNRITGYTYEIDYISDTIEVSVELYKGGIDSVNVHFKDYVILSDKEMYWLHRFASVLARYIPEKFKN